MRYAISARLPAAMQQAISGSFNGEPPEPFVLTPTELAPEIAVPLNLTFELIAVRFDLQVEIIQSTDPALSLAATEIDASLLIGGGAYDGLPVASAVLTPTKAVADTTELQQALWSGSELLQQSIQIDATDDLLLQVIVKVPSGGQIGPVQVVSSQFSVTPTTPQTLVRLYGNADIKSGRG